MVSVEPHHQAPRDMTISPSHRSPSTHTLTRFRATSPMAPCPYADPSANLKSKPIKGRIRARDPVRSRPWRRAR